AVASLTFPVNVSVDLSSVPANTQATLFFDLIGFSPAASSVEISDVTPAAATTTPTANPQSITTPENTAKSITLTASHPATHPPPAARPPRRTRAPPHPHPPSRPLRPAHFPFKGKHRPPRQKRPPRLYRRHPPPARHRPVADPATGHRHTDHPHRLRP